MRTAQSPGSSEEVNYAPFLLYPTPFPHTQFEQAKSVQCAFNKLMHLVACDVDFLRSVLER